MLHIEKYINFLGGDAFMLKTNSIIFRYFLMLMFLLNSMPGYAAILAKSDLISKYGKIEEQYRGKNTKHVYIIQNSHAKYSAQKNISNILEALKIKYIGVEGAWTSIDTSVLYSIKNNNLREKLVDRLCKNGYMTGAELYQYKLENNVSLIGLEDENLYLKNFTSLYASVLLRDNVNDTFEKINNIIELTKQIVYTSQMLRLDNKIKAYKARRINFIDYAKEIYAYAGNTYEYPSVHEYLSTGIMRNATGFLYEFIELEKSVKNKMSSGTKDTSKLVRLEYMLELFYRYLTNDLTRRETEEWELLRKDMPSLLDDLGSRMTYNNEIKQLVDSLIKTEKYMKSFYKYARKRDEIMAKKLDDIKENKLAIVIGGYHVEGIVSFLRAKGISYTVIVPKLDNIDLSEKIYLERIKDQAKRLHIDQNIVVKYDSNKNMTMYPKLANVNYLELLTMFPSEEPAKVLALIDSVGMIRYGRVMIET
jgi:hypothetical protein